MALPPVPDRDLETAVRQARLVAFTCCYLAPAMYVLSFASQVLRGRWQLFFAGFGQLPWADPRVPGALAAAAAALALAFILPARPGGGATLARLRGRNLLTCGLLVLVAAAGLYLGVKIGPPAASLSLVNRSRRNTTAIKIAKIALVSRSAAPGATGACVHTHRINTYDAIDATAVGTAMLQAPPRLRNFAPRKSWRIVIDSALVIETVQP